MSRELPTVELLQGIDNGPAKVFNSPGLVTEGWKQAEPIPVHSDRRTLRLRKGGQRLTTKGG